MAMITFVVVMTGILISISILIGILWYRAQMTTSDAVAERLLFIAAPVPILGFLITLFMLYWLRHLGLR
jgi:hypothetical protein